MAQTSVNNLLYLLVILLVVLLGLTTSVAAIGMRIDLDKTYQFKNTNVSAIEAIDLWDLSQSCVTIQTTSGGDTDLQTIHMPVIRQVTRNFQTMTGTFNGITITITGANPSTVDWTTKPDFKIYKQYSVPTFSLVIPGKIGNPIVAKYNESWNKGDTSSVSSLFRSSEGGYLYKNLGALHVNVSTDTYIVSGVFQTSDYNKDDINFTLNHNLVALDSFTADRTSSNNMGLVYPETKASTGKYFISAISHNEFATCTTVYALAPMVVLRQATPMWWTNSSGSHALPMTYAAGQTPGDVALNFSGTNPDLANIRNLTYLFINRSVQYDMYQYIDTNQLAKNAETRWQNSFNPGTHIIDLLYEGIRHDVGTPFNYTMTAVGYATPARSTQWSVIAITPGFGISGNTTFDNITIPAANMSALNPGLYDVLLMGTDFKNDIVALDQGQVEITSGVTVPVANFTTDVNQSGHNLRVQFYDNSTNTPTSWNWSFGDGNITDITVQNPVHYYIQNDIAPNQTYSVSLNATNAAGSNTVTKPNYILVKSFSQFYRGASVPYTGMISTSEFTVAIEDWRLGRIPTGYTKSPPTIVFTVLIEDWRLGRPLT